MTIGYYGGDGFGISPYGSIPPQVGVLNATSLNSTHVEVNFTLLLDFMYLPILTIGNYSISSGLTVIGVTQTADNAVVLTTIPQSNILYTVTVSQARSTFGTLLNPAQNSTTFTGSEPIPGFLAVALTSRRVRLLFSQVLAAGSALSDVANYTVTDLNSNVLTILSATPEQSINPLSVILTLSSSLGESDFYVATVSSNIKTIYNLSVLPSTYVFQWLKSDNQFQVPLSSFSGEVSGGLLGDPDGLVFFSPALNVSTPNSIIQVEDIDVCTTAYDSYTQPSPIDPIPLFLYGGGLVPTPNPDPYLLNQCVLWAPWPRNFEAQINLGFTGEGNQDFYTPPVDTSCSIIINQQFALGYVALLNDPAWYLLPALSPPQSVPPMFITADNLAPIPPGPETIIVLRVQLGGTSAFAPPTATKHGLMSTDLDGFSTFIGAAGPPPVVLAGAALPAPGASVRARGSVVAHATAHLAGQGFLSSAAVVPPPPWFITTLQGLSFLDAPAIVRRGASAPLDGSASVRAMATVRRGAVASPAGVATVTPRATAHWKAHAAIEASSAVIATATVTHKSEAFIEAAAKVTPTPL